VGDEHARIALQQLVVPPAERRLAIGEQRARPLDEY